MEQPELGKKIAELRKAKGLTQEELVEKCNINVRTLQRIEAGVATPRSYTIKVIFAALDYRIYGSSESSLNGFNNLGLISSKWLEQAYRYVIDLFNLKTKTMKKLLILSVPFFIICTVLIFSFNENMKAQAKIALRDKFEKTSSHSKFIKWFNSGQIDSIASLYLENACMMPDNSPMLNGREQVKEYYKHLYNSGFRFSIVKSTSVVISDSIAVDRGIWSLSPEINSSGYFLAQWHLIKGVWWIENEMTKSDNTIDPGIEK
jgi:transcriptional regulator with XRE-family HTH domain